MNCRDLRALSSDYCDGELSSANRAEMNLHLDGCAACRAEIAAEREIIRRAAEWRRDVEPERDLWPAIEAQISSRRGSVVQGPWFKRSYVGWAAAAALIAAVGFMIARQPESPAGPRAGSLADSGPAYEAPRETAPSALMLASERARVDGGLMHVREDMLRSIGERRGELDAETQAMVDRNLRIIDRAIGEIYQALEDDPENRVLEQLLAAAYQREAEFVKQINML